MGLEAVWCTAVVVTVLIHTLESADPSWDNVDNLEKFQGGKNDLRSTKPALQWKTKQAQSI